jgi:hypothetical protein
VVGDAGGFDEFFGPGYRLAIFDQWAEERRIRGDDGGGVQVALVGGPAGNDPINTPAGASCPSRYFCTTKPPRECPITTGRAGRLSATESTSST